MNTSTSSLRWFLAGFWAYWGGGKSVVTGRRWSSQHMKRPGFLNGGGFRPRKETS